MDCPIPAYLQDWFEFQFYYLDAVSHMMPFDDLYISNITWLSEVGYLVLGGGGERHIFLTELYYN